MLPKKNTTVGIPARSFRILTGLVMIGLTLGVFFVEAPAQPAAVNWEKVSRLRPDLRIMVQVTSPRPISLEDLASLAQAGLKPADRDPGLVLGLKKAVFSVTLRNWKPERLPGHLRAELLDRFIMSGIYRVSFIVEEEGFEGPLTLEITAPRDGFGQQLLDSENLVRPRASSRISRDSAGNRWFQVSLRKIRSGETIKFHFAFRYQVDMAQLLEHDLLLLEQSAQAPIPEDLRLFLASGHKIDTQIPEAVAWAKAGTLFGPADVRSAYLKVKRFIDGTIQYDERKKASYFGGKAIYSNLDDMYQDVPFTLARKLGACPDTSVLECALLRAQGIPCRTAGRFGHFLTHLYVSGRGWFSTSIHPTGIPLIVAPGPDNVAYQKWSPPIALRTVTLDKKIRILAGGDQS